MATRILLILCWVGLVFGILFWPKTSYFHSHDARTLHIFAWGDSLDQNILRDFEKLYDCRIKTHGYTSNEEMMVKLKTTGTKGYDLIIPSDYAVKLLIKEGLVQEIDHARLSFFERLYPWLLNHSFDPGNRFSLPLQWDVLGFGVNKETIPSQTLGWKEVLNHPPYLITMVNDPVEAICIASQHLYGNVDALNKEQKEEIKRLLLKQKPAVEAYVECRADYLLSTKNCTLAVSPASYIWRLEEECPFARFVIPSDHIFLSIENFAIPKATEKLDLVYDFLNYMYSRENLTRQSTTYYLMPPTLDVIDDLPCREKAWQMINEIESREGEKFHFFRHLLPERDIRELWIDVKS